MAARNTILGMDDIKNRINSVFISAIQCKWDSAKIRDYLNERVWQELNSKTPSGRKRYSMYMHGYAQGIIDSSRLHISRDLVEFCYRDTDGVLYSTSRNTNRRTTEEWYQAGKGAELGKLPHAFYWKDSSSVYF